jgi:hypothetical protein
MSEKVRYTHHPRKLAGSPEGGRFASGKAVKIMPVLTKPRTVVVPVFDAAAASGGSGSPVNRSRPRGGAR